MTGTLPLAARGERGWRPRVLLVRFAGLIGGAVAALWAAATMSFVLMRVIPGDPVSVMLGPQSQVSEEVKEELREQLGLTRPLAEQYVTYLAGLLRGDLGTSYQLRLPVTEVIGAGLPATLQLAGMALVFALVLVTLVTVFARGRVSGKIAATIEQIVLSTPVFWIGLLLLSVFAFGLHWFPISASRGFASIVLPALTLALPTAALLGQVLRDGIEAAERSAFMETARSRGAAPSRLLFRHSLRHGAIGTIPMLAYLTGSLLGGAVLVETVFARNGLGRTALAAIMDRDLPVIAGIIMLSTLWFVIVAIIADLCVPLLDPRQRARRVAA